MSLIETPRSSEISPGPRNKTNRSRCRRRITDNKSPFTCPAYPFVIVKHRGNYLSHYSRAELHKSGSKALHTRGHNGLARAWSRATRERKPWDLVCEFVSGRLTALGGETIQTYPKNQAIEHFSSMLLQVGSRLWLYTQGFEVNIMLIVWDVKSVQTSVRLRLTLPLQK